MAPFEQPDLACPWATSRAASAALAPLALAPVKWVRALRAQWLLPRFVRETLSLIPEKFYEVNLPEKTGDDHAFVEHLWARRKVGYMLDQIRVNGESKELVAIACERRASSPEIRRLREVCTSIVST